MLRVDIGEKNTIKDFEKRVLERLDDGFMLPVTVVDEAGETYLLYRTDGCTALNEYEPRDLSDVFCVARSFVMGMMEGRDRLLDPRKFFVTSDRVFIRDGATDMGLLFGDSGEEKGADAELILPILRELSGLRHIVGAKSAISRITEQLQNGNPGFADICKIIEAAERDWHCIQPSNM
ncbi:MAG: hypothetical protein LBQ21_05915 [Clostridiales Family XIII bacterium]|jgi:hypothetical protein|nr:hypothetical protein [Clostridiales Family XIII bacterium]